MLCIYITVHYVVYLYYSARCIKHKNGGFKLFYFLTYSAFQNDQF